MNSDLTFPLYLLGRQILPKQRNEICRKVYLEK